MQHIELPRGKIAEFCRRNHIRRLSLFGSVLRGDFRPDSDIDFLVEFDPDHIPGLIKLAGIEMELSELLGRKVDLRTPQDLSRYFMEGVCHSAEVHYAEKMILYACAVCWTLPSLSSSLASSTRWSRTRAGTAQSRRSLSPLSPSPAIR